MSTKLKNKGKKPKEYGHLKIEKKWQKEWARKKVYKAQDKSKKKKFYILDMFPYPSGEGLHVGHPKGYIATDVVSRMKRMQNFNVLHPMGWDAFGLPAENYAIKTKTNPVVSVAKNVAHYKKQLEVIGLDYDWSREINTTDPKYYKWTQWIFLKLLEKGLAFESHEPVNWCPVDKTVLANEDVEDGRCERCGSIVEKKPIRQWVLRITDYAERMLKDLDALNWPESIKESQRNWIGKSEGAEIEFPIIIKNNKPRFVLLHGFEGHASTNFFPWLKLSLEQSGYEVEVPELPHTNNPTETEQVEFVLKNCKFDENTVILGHSLGCIVGMKVVTKLGKKISGMTLVAPAVDPAYHHDSKAFKKNFNWDFDFAKIKELTNGRIAILADTQEKFRIPYLEHLSKELGAWLRPFKAKKQHFLASVEPEILKSVTPLINVFTTRPDTIFGATYVVLAPEHAWVSELLEKLKNKKEVEDYIASVKNKGEALRTATGKEKTGVELEGLKARNPANGEELPIWIADYVLSTYGTGAIMAVPADDKRDEEFAQKFNLPIIKDYKPAGFVDFGKKVTKYKLRDWVFSRQRYWGEPIPVLRDGDKVVPLKEKDLPLVLPKVKSYEPTGTAESPLANISGWMNVKIGKKILRRESNTMPQWAGSSWYYLRYMDPHNNKALVDKKKEKYWNTVDLYVGGAEHATRHLIYARFWHKFLYDIGVVSTKEPFERLQNVGLIIASDGRKMSKRFGNVINPDSIVSTFGADSLRLYEMFMGPFNQSVAWGEENILGVRRFLDRVWRLQTSIDSKLKNSNIKIESLLHKTVKKVSDDIESMAFNTAVSSMMILLNEIEREEKISRKDFEMFLKILSPFAPHITEEIWHNLGNKTLIVTEKWPVADTKKMKDSEVNIAIQINNKVRAVCKVSSGSGEGEVVRIARSLPDVEKWLLGKQIQKVIFVKDKLVNIIAI